MSHLFQDDGPKASGKKVCLATTSYDNPDAAYTFSLQRSRKALEDAGIQSAYFLLKGNCHVDDAGNVIVQEFLLSDCTDLVFLDSDVSWDPEDIVALCQSDKELVGGVYPWRKDMSLDTMPVRMAPGLVMIPDDNGLLEVHGLPTGFMKIKRHVLEMLVKDADAFWNRQDRRMKVPIIFERSFDNETGTRWGGDLNFCNKWRAVGGKVYAMSELRLGHATQSTNKDSLGAVIRRNTDTTLKHIVQSIQDGADDKNTYAEAVRYNDNKYGILEDVLLLAVLMAKKADGHIIEAGSGLTTILMAAANPDHTVYCLESDPFWAEKLKRMAWDAGVGNIGLCLCPIKDGWYDLTDMDLPAEFALGLNDGPSRKEGYRMPFFKVFGDRCESIVIDDVDDPVYAESVRNYAKDHDKKLDFIDSTRAAVIRQPEPDKVPVNIKSKAVA